MKRYLIQLTALSLLALIAGCQKERDGIDNERGGSTTAINISIDGLPIDAATTRAVVDDITDITTHGFTLAGYYTEGGVAPDPVTDGTFDAHIATTKPNVFDYQGGSSYSGDAVLVPVLKDGKYEVVLSKWQLRENSYLSYVAWASKVAPGENSAVADNSIWSATKNGGVGNPFIMVYSGTPSKSHNTDVVAAKSTDNLNDVVRSAVDLDFKHVMTKLKFRVKNDSPAAMTLTGARVLFADGIVSRYAKYTFDGTPSRVGTFGSYDSKAAATYPVTLTPTDLVSKGAAVPLEELLIIPQALVDGAISVELTYTILNGAAASTYTRTVPLKARTYEQNTSYTYEISLNETQIAINEGRIGAWIEVPTGDLPYIVGARDPKVLLLLDGYDAPYTHTDGTQYWLDRSGWNRHCKLVGGVTYDATEKCYTFDGLGSTYGELPAMPSTSSATIDFVARSSRAYNSAQGDAQNVFRFELSDGKRVMNIHFNYVGGDDFYLDAGQTSSSAGYTRVSGRMPTNEAYRPFAMYRATGNNANLMFFRNISHPQNTRTTAVPYQSIDLSSAPVRQIGYQFQGKIKYMKIMNVAKFTMSDATNKAEFAELKKRHKLPDEEYIGNSLLSDLRGTDPLVGGVWTNRAATGAKYNATMQGAKNLITYNAAGKYYQIGTEGNSSPNGGPAYFSIDPVAAGLSSLETFTIDMVFKSHFGNHDCLMIQTANDNNARGIFYSSYYNDGKIRFQAPTGSSLGGMQVYEAMYGKPPVTPPTKENPIGVTQIRSNVLVRRFGGSAANSYLYVYVDNAQLIESVHGTNSPAVGRPNTIKIGQGGIQISAFRIYNRELSNFERTWNYQVDQGNYNIP